MNALKRAAFACAVLLTAAAASVGVAAPAYTGDCGVWASKSHDYYSKFYTGAQAGYDAAKAYVGTNGIIQILPGCEEEITTGSLPDSVIVIRSDAGRWHVIGGSVGMARLGPRSTATTGGAVRIIDGITFPQTGVGVQAAVDEVIAAGGGLVFMPRGRYRWTAAVVLNNAVGVSVQGAGDSTVLWLDHASGDDIFRVAGTSSDLTFRDFTIDGDYANNTAGRGIDVESATARNVTAERLTILRTNDAAIASQGARTVIRDCRIYEIGDAVAGDRWGIYLYGGTADSSRVEGNDVRSCKDGTIQAATNTDFLTIADNKFVNPPGYGANYNVRVCEGGGKHLRFEANYVNGTDGAVLAGIGADSSQVLGNTFTNGRIYSALYFWRGKSVLVANNVASYSREGIYVGFDQGDCTDFVITGNLCIANSFSGIVVNPSTTRTFTRIAIFGNYSCTNGQYGINVSAASFASSAIIGPNTLLNNTSGQTALSSTNWSYLPPAFHSGLDLMRGDLRMPNQAGTANPLVTTAGTDHPRYRGLSATGDIFFQNFTGDTTHVRLLYNGGIQWKWKSDATTNSWVNGSGSRVWAISPGSARTITTIAGSGAGGIVTLVFTNANTTVNETGNIKINGTSWTPAVNSTLTLVFDGTLNKWIETGRMTD